LRSPARERAGTSIQRGSARCGAIRCTAFRSSAVVLRTTAGSRVDPARLVDLLNDRALGVRLGEGQRILAAAPDKAPAALFARARWLLEAVARREPAGPGGPASVAGP